jgi:hypothetical protein
MKKYPGSLWSITLCLIAVAMCGAGVAHAQTGKPNILVIWGADIGVHNISAYNTPRGP